MQEFVKERFSGGTSLSKFNSGNQSISSKVLKHLFDCILRKPVRVKKKMKEAKKDSRYYAKVYLLFEKEPRYFEKVSLYSEMISRLFEKVRRYF